MEKSYNSFCRSLVVGACPWAALQAGTPITMPATPHPLEGQTHAVGVRDGAAVGAHVMATTSRGSTYWMGALHTCPGSGDRRMFPGVRGSSTGIGSCAGPHDPGWRGCQSEKGSETERGISVTSEHDSNITPQISSCRAPSCRPYCDWIW